MTTRSRFAGTRFTRIILITAAALAAGVFAFPSPARADNWGHDHGHGNGHGHASGYPGHSGHGAVTSYPTVPRMIPGAQRGYYQPYYNGRVYYAPHHHYHATYSFPVYVGGSVVYEPYYYCGDSLFVSGAVTLPHLAFGINFGSPGGVSVGGYYASPGVVAPVAPYPYPYAAPYPYPAPYPYVAPYPYAGGVVYYRQPLHEHHDYDHDGD